jgi:hypothetical protein
VLARVALALSVSRAYVASSNHVVASHHIMYTHSLRRYAHPHALPHARASTFPRSISIGQMLRPSSVSSLFAPWRVCVCLKDGEGRVVESTGSSLFVAVLPKLVCSLSSFKPTDGGLSIYYWHWFGPGMFYVLSLGGYRCIRICRRM